MKKNEFYKAVCAYLAGKATSWQVFIVDDHFDSFQHLPDILDQLSNKESSQIGERLKMAIRRKLDTMDKGMQVGD